MWGFEQTRVKKVFTLYMVCIWLFQMQGFFLFFLCNLFFCQECSRKRTSDICICMCVCVCLGHVDCTEGYPWAYHVRPYEFISYSAKWLFTAGGSWHYLSPLHPFLFDLAHLSGAVPGSLLEPPHHWLDPLDGRRRETGEAHGGGRHKVRWHKEPVGDKDECGGCVKVARECHLLTENRKRKTLRFD